MKFFIVFALALASASGFDLRSNNIESSNVVEPIAEPEGRIINGQLAAIGQFPYQVGLSLKVSDTSYFWCGGCLISNEWILTAAHCLNLALTATVYLGSTIRFQAEVIHTVSRKNFIVHPDFEAATLRDDIAMLRMPYTGYTTKIQPIDLPAIASSYPTYVGEMVVASGWGFISDLSTTFSKNLRWARMPVISNAACNETYGSSLYSSKICVSTAGDVSTCRGDSGGPLVSESKKDLIGVTSHGYPDGCDKGYPAVFTRVDSFLQWINTILAFPTK